MHPRCRPGREACECQGHGALSDSAGGNAMSSFWVIWWKFLWRCNKETLAWSYLRILTSPGNCLVWALNITRGVADWTPSSWEQRKKKSSVASIQMDSGKSPFYEKDGGNGVLQGTSSNQHCPPANPKGNCFSAWPTLCSAGTEGRRQRVCTWIIF